MRPNDTRQRKDIAQMLHVASQPQETGQVYELGMSGCERTNEGLFEGNFHTRLEEIDYHRTPSKTRHQSNLDITSLANAGRA